MSSPFGRGFDGSRQPGGGGEGNLESSSSSSSDSSESEEEVPFDFVDGEGFVEFERGGREGGGFKEGCEKDAARGMERFIKGLQ